MRKIYVGWLLGLAAISTMTGCGLTRTGRPDSCGANGCTTPGTVRDKATLVGSARVVVSEPARVQRTERRLVVDKASALPAEEVQVARRLPETIVPDKRVDLPAVEKGNALAQEMAVVSRELAAMPKKGAAVVAEPMPARRIVPPLPVLPEDGAPAGKVIGGSDKEKTIEPKSVDIQYGQGENFKTITGQVQQFRKTWRLRYADVDQEDSYGGVVILEGDLGQLRDGQHVRVTGVLIPPASRTSSATYRVQTIKILD